eukprot:1177828-Prorocentrum_minimum.AAC.4
MHFNYHRHAQQPIALLPAKQTTSYSGMCCGDRRLDIPTSSKAGHGAFKCSAISEEDMSALPSVALNSPLASASKPHRPRPLHFLNKYANFGFRPGLRGFPGPRGPKSPVSKPPIIIVAATVDHAR